MRYWMIVLFGLLPACATQRAASVEDPYLWLEEIDGERALEWVHRANAESVPRLQAVDGYQETYARILEVLDSKERIPHVARLGDYLYNFWRDGEHPRGIYRRTTLAEYREEEPAWELILDIDALAREEGENWVYKGISHLYPDFDRALVRLSRGGADAVVVREFDIPTRSFVEDGFNLPEAKSSVAWRDLDNLYVATDFGPGSLTTSGYPRQVKLWKRGTPLTKALILHEAPERSMSASGRRWFSESGHLDLIVEATSFYTRDHYIEHEGLWHKLDLPEDLRLADYIMGNLLLLPRKDWTVAGKTFKAGSVLIAPLASILAGKPAPELLIEPTERVSIRSVDTTRSAILISVLDNVVGRLYRFTQAEGNRWVREPVPVPNNRSLHVSNASEMHDDYFLTFTGHLEPPTLYRAGGEDGRLERLKSQPAFFDATPFEVVQLQARSADGTLIPYFLIKSRDLVADGKNPTLLYGYGGFEVSLAPSYNGALGAWLERGGIYVVANIRGGGEFGPRWHQAALLKNRHKAFEDFIAVAEDLIARKITTPRHLAIQGGSNGGLLVGAVMVKRPELFRAVICQVPLLDMRRYSKLLAGASWMAEYGDPDDPEMWDYIATYSPYQNLDRHADYPAIFITTSTRDDRVHPGHARKMAAKMQAQGHTVFYFENLEGGHGGAANNEQRALMSALGYAFLFDQLWPKADD